MSVLSPTVDKVEHFASCGIELEQRTGASLQLCQDDVAELVSP